MHLRTPLWEPHSDNKRGVLLVDRVPDRLRPQRSLCVPCRALHHHLRVALVGDVGRGARGGSWPGDPWWNLEAGLEVVAGGPFPAPLPALHLCVYYG